MVEIPSEIRSIVENYIQSLESSRIRIRHAILFGSRTAGRADEWSDIDIAIVSDDFEGIRFKDKEKIRKTTLATSFLLSPLPFKTSDFSDDNPLVRHIKATGLTIK
ncbi:nucleotidyltransferase domain-containing protein [Desulfonatronovibrio hydrogenovorans]|uniref:nucleotidyltransferase domain-containing protein n=1 Tax=Desulfonatronovibrio hydrogenovorans TaxID=53245 RepID=UPI00049009E1|nr:nucleotidyltransferase domain-containing protein [Desulfonatronovibrio hydrogenovorans]